MRKNKIDYQKLTQETIRLMRGHKTQGMLNRKLQFRGNQMYRWESGQRSVSWKNFVKLASACKVDLESILKEHLGFFDRPDNTRALIRHLIGQNSIVVFSKSCGVSRSLVSSWLAGRREPSFEQVLSMLDFEGYLPQFIKAINPSRYPESLQSLALLQKNKRELQYIFPEVAEVLACLTLKEYTQNNRHKEGLIASVLGITLDHEKKLFQSMLEVGYITQESSGKYVVNEHALDTRGDFQGAVALRKFWIKKSLELLDHLESITDRSRYAYFVVSVSEFADKKMREAMYEYASKIKMIVATDVGDKVFVRSLNIQDIDIAEHAKKCASKDDPV